MSSQKGAPDLPDKNPKNQAESDSLLDDSELGAISKDIADALEVDEVLDAEDSSVEQVSEEAVEVDKGQAEVQTAAEPETAAESPESDDSLDSVVEEIAEEDKQSFDAESAESKSEPTEHLPLATPKRQNKLVEFIKNTWSNPKKRWAIVGGSTVLFLGLALVPQSRYFILNTARVRASVELKVVDSGTLQPLKNVTVKAAGTEAKTDSDGVAKLNDARLGSTNLIIEKRAFSTTEQSITVGWGSNPLGEYSIEAVGSQYTFIIKDKFSGKAIASAEAASGEGNASSDEEGKLVLTLDTASQDDAAQVVVEISADGYRTEQHNITVNNKETQSVEMVPDKKHVFVSKRSGNYDVYTVDVDGKNEKRIVSGSGYERDDISLVPHASKNMAAYVATRENTRNQTGYLLSTLYLLDLETGEPVKIDQSEQIMIIGWSNEGRLIYLKVASGASGNDPKRHRIISFNSADLSDTKEIAASNSFNDVKMADNRIYYAPSNIFNETSPVVVTVRPDGSDSKNILDKEAFTITRTNYDKMYFSVGDSWYEYVIGSPTAASSSAPGSTTGRMYSDSPSGKLSLWMDSRDGKGVLLKYDKATRQESSVIEKGGMKEPLYWIGDNYVVFRVADRQQTADYIMSLDGGEAHKIIDVTDTSGVQPLRYF